MCLQLDKEGRQTKGDEDCLVLNVHKPGNIELVLRHFLQWLFAYTIYYVPFLTFLPILYTTSPFSHFSQYSLAL